jgi:hypothetical protein
MINFPEVDTVLPADPEAPSSAYANRSRGLPWYDACRRTRAQANASSSYAGEEPRPARCDPRSSFAQRDEHLTRRAPAAC